jgi:hypothetical protein
VAFVIGVPPQVGSLALSRTPIAIHPQPVIAPVAAPELKVTTLPLGPAPVLPPAPPAGGWVLPPPEVPPVLGFSVPLLPQELAKITKALQTATEVKAKLVLIIVLFLAFMSPSRLVFAYSITERPQMGKTI